MGILNKVQTWWTEQTKRSEAIREKNKNKEQEKLNKNIEILMNPSSSAFEKATATGILSGLLTTKSVKVDYLGGHYKLTKSKEDAKVIILPVGILINGTDSIITYEEIESLEFKTESEIQKDVTLTRMIAFGVYSLAMKKKRKIVKNYLIITCNKQGMKYNMVFAGEGVLKLHSEIFQRKTV